VYRAGPTFFDNPTTDPFFQATNAITARFNENTTETKYTPDYEATVLACLEQYQFCTQRKEMNNFCTTWGETIETIGDLLYHLASMNDWKDFASALLDRITILGSATDASSVYTTSLLRKVVSTRKNLLRYGDSIVINNYSGNDEQWILELETWFMRAIIDAIFRMKVGPRFSLGGFSTNDNFYGLFFDNKTVEEWASCGRVLFHDGNYTNIYWYEFHTAWVALITICLVSYLLPQLESATQKIFKFLIIQVLPQAKSAIRFAAASLNRWLYDVCRGISLLSTKYAQ
jgi:hypothetical protein